MKNGMRRIDVLLNYAMGKNANGYHNGDLHRFIGRNYFDELSLMVYLEYVDKEGLEDVSRPQP